MPKDPILTDEATHVDYHEQENIPTLIIDSSSRSSQKQVFFRHAPYQVDFTIEGYEGIYQRINETSVIDQQGNVKSIARQTIISYD